jgi:putative ABC transport system permease protein
LEASAGSTPFDVLFMALSMFVIGSALILVVLLFRLSFQQRASEVGILSAVGLPHSKLRWIWLTEMSFVALVGAGVGVLIGIGYAALMIWGLTTWWVDAISKPFLNLHVGSASLVGGLLSGWLVSTLTIAWSLRGALKCETRNLLAGQLERTTPRTPQRIAGVGNAGTPAPAGPRWLGRTVFVLVGCAMVLTLIAVRLAGEAQAGAFMGAGFLILTAGLLFVYQKLRGGGAQNRSEVDPTLSLFRLALRNAQRNPLRSTLTIGLVAVASFLISAVSAFRLAPTEQGTGGFDWVARSSQPISMDLSTIAGRQRWLGEASAFHTSNTIVPIRYRRGEDASCNNLYQSTQPQVLGLPQLFIDQFQPNENPNSRPQFAWGGNLAESQSEKANPWILLSGTSAHSGALDDPIPTVIDKNTANYSLKIYRLNSIFEMEADDGRLIHFRVVGFLSNSILQGSLLISEKDFISAFPSIGGYQYFLIREGASPGGANSSTPLAQLSSASKLAEANSNEPLEKSAAPDLDGRQAGSTASGAGGRLEKSAGIQRLEERLGDYGFEARSAVGLLANFLKVQNTYISTFQTLGSLGLLLGTLGLAVVQLRAVLERKRELGLMRAVGFTSEQLGQMVLAENGVLLGLGLAVGIGAALFTTLPHGWLGQASIPWIELGWMFGAIALIGLIASFLASKKITQIPLLESLRN